jgi:hypothetical protein
MTERFQITKIGLFMSPEEEKEVRQMEETIERVLFKFFKGKVSSLCELQAKKTAVCDILTRSLRYCLHYLAHASALQARVRA